MYVYLHEKNICTCFCKRYRHGLSNASCPTRYECGLALEREQVLDVGHLCSLEIGFRMLFNV